MPVMFPPEPEPTRGQEEEEDVGDDKRVSDKSGYGLRTTARLGRPLKVFLIVVLLMLQ